VVAVGVQQQGIRHAEDRRIGADAERESENHDRGEAGRLAKHAKRMADVLKQRFEEREAASFAVLFPCLL